MTPDVSLVIARSTAMCSAFSEGLRPGRPGCVFVSSALLFAIKRSALKCLGAKITRDQLISFTPSERALNIYEDTVGLAHRETESCVLLLAQALRAAGKGGSRSDLLRRADEIEERRETDEK